MALIRVASYTTPKVDSPLLDPAGDPIPGDLGTTTLVNALTNPDNFGPGGIVECSVQFLPPVETVLPGSLVNPNGTLNAEAFFGGRGSVTITAQEAAELAAFINAGGVVYISGNSGVNQGPNYNPLFAALGATDAFSNTNQAVGLVPSSVPAATPVTTGPFGIVGPVLITIFKIFVPGTITSAVATDTTANNIVLAEGAPGLGYLSVSGDAIYLNLQTADPNNLNYFLNLFALACNRVLPTRGIDISKFTNAI